MFWSILFVWRVCNGEISIWKENWLEAIIGYPTCPQPNISVRETFLDSDFWHSYVPDIHRVFS